MKASLKPFFLLSSLVLTIYVMRHTDVSVGNLVRRALDEYRPSATLCQGTNLNQVYTQSEIKRAQSFKDNLEKMRGGNPLATLVFGSSSVSTSDLVTYAKGLIPFIAPWAAMFIFSILSAIILTCNWCCIYGCCKNSTCCKCCKAPKNSSRKRIYVTISTIFFLGGIGSGIAGLIVGGGVPKGITLTLCNFINVAETLEYGSSTTSDHWVGVTGAIDSLNTLSDQFSYVQSHLSSSTTSTSTVQTAMNDVETQLQDMITNLNANGADAPLPRPDPSQASSTYDTYYMANLQPATDESTMTGMIQAEVELKYDILDNAQTVVNSAINTIKTTDVGSLITSAIGTVTDYSNMIQDNLKTIGKYGQTGKTAIKGVGYGLTAIFAATMTFAVFGIGALILVGLLKLKTFNKFLHSSWMGFVYMSILGFLLSTILYPTSVVLMEACDVLEVALNDDTLFSTAINNAFGGGTISGILNVCMTGDGDIITYFGLDSDLSTFLDMNDQFNAITAVMPISTTPPPSYTLAYQDDFVAGCKSGKYTDATEIGTDLATLDGIVNHNDNGCSTSYDTWMLNSVNCTTDGETVFASGDADDYNLGNPTCIGFDVWGTKSSVNRYATNPFSSCGNTGSMPTQTYVESFVTAFQTNRASVYDVFNKVQIELTSVQSKYDAFANEVANVLGDFVNIQNELNTIDAAIFDADTGLLNNMNCNFIRTSFDNISNAMCIGFISSVYQSSIVIIICSCMSFFGAIFAFCLAKRFVLEEPDAKPKPI